MPAQSSRSIGFLMLVGSSLTLCGIICNNNAMLSPGFLRYDPSKSNYGLLVTIVVSGVFAFLQTNPLKSRQSLSCLCGTAEAPLGMPEATPTTHQALRGRIQTYFYGLPTLSSSDPMLCSCFGVNHARCENILRGIFSPVNRA